MKSLLLIDHHRISVAENGYLSLSDLAQTKETIRPELLLQKWLQSNRTLNLLIAWEKLYNPNFKSDNLTDLITQNITPKFYLETTNGLALVILEDSVYAPREIALDFCNWVDPNLFFSLNSVLKK